MYGWRARIGNISPTVCAEIFPYEFYRVAPKGVTLVTTNLVIRDAGESSKVEASWENFNTTIENLAQTRVDELGNGARINDYGTLLRTLSGEKS
jgi:hypothetical protein